MEQLLPARVAALPGFPISVRDAALGMNSDTASKKAETASDKNSSRDAAAEPGYAATSFRIVKALRAVTANGDDSEPSWSILAELIYEEIFVQAASYLHVSLNATESSHGDEVNAMLPVLKDHRYAPYIESYGVDANRDPDKYTAVLDRLRVVDPRGNMWAMLATLWHMKDDEGKNERGINLSWRAYSDCGLTFTGMVEAAILQSSVWWDHTKPWRQKEIGADWEAISPFAPQTLRINVGLVDEPSADQLAKRQSEAGEDPAIFVRLGDAFHGLNRFDDAIYCFERSIELSPSKDAFVSLAESYRASGREEMWLPTLERFFEVPAHGLEHASVHQLIAEDMIGKGKWNEAAPHAVAAAETWSAWGLLLASRCYEGLGRWDESEKWVREAATAYPTSSGHEWYFWCRRTGRGDVDSARKLAEQTLSAERFQRQLGSQAKLLTQRVLDNNIQDAFEVAKNYVQLAANQNVADDDIVYEQLHLALLATELKQQEIAHSTIQEVRRKSAAFREQYPDFSDVNIAVCDVLDGKPPSAEGIARLNQQLEEKVNEASRCNYRYFLGRAFDLTGNKELAEAYWLECVTKGPFDRQNATLAGKYLSDRNKTSRP